MFLGNSWGKSWGFLLDQPPVASAVPGLVNIQKLLKMLIYSGFTYEKWWIFP
jgi:hypothetical protein